MSRKKLEKGLVLVMHRALDRIYSPRNHAKGDNAAHNRQLWQIRHAAKYLTTTPSVWNRDAWSSPKTSPNVDYRAYRRQRDPSMVEKHIQWIEKIESPSHRFHFGILFQASQKCVNKLVKHYIFHAPTVSLSCCCARVLSQRRQNQNDHGRWERSSGGEFLLPTLPTNEREDRWAVETRTIFETTHALMNYGNSSSRKKTV